MAKKVPTGNVYTVDNDFNITKQAKKNLQYLYNVKIIQSSFTDIKISIKMDVIFLTPLFIG
jgi:tRNA A58 N-methylase Trm61